MAKGQRSRRYFSPEFKAETVELIRSSGRSIPDVCADLDLTVTTVRNWVRQARISKRDYSGAVADLQAAVAIDPHSPVALNRLAWIQATSPDASVHRGGSQSCGTSCCGTRASPSRITT